MALAALESISAFSVPSSFLVVGDPVELALGGGLAHLELLGLAAKSAITWRCWSLYSETVVSWFRKLSGSSASITWVVEESAWPWYWATTALATCSRTVVDLGLLAAEVGRSADSRVCACFSSSRALL